MCIVSATSDFIFGPYPIYVHTVESRYVKLGLLEISVKSKFFWSPVLHLVLFNLHKKHIYSTSYFYVLLNRVVAHILFIF
jgi:hypothetical protein